MRVKKFYIIIAIMILIVCVIIIYNVTYGVKGIKVTVGTKGHQVTEATLGQAIQVGSWRLRVLSIREATYIRALGCGIGEFHKAPEGTKIVIITLEIENGGVEPVELESVFKELSLPLLVTNSNKSYERAYAYQLDYIWNWWELPREVRENAVMYRELELQLLLLNFSSKSRIAPGSSIEVDLMYLIPSGEKPSNLIIAYQTGFPKSKELVVRLPLNS